MEWASIINNVDSFFKPARLGGKLLDINSNKISKVAILILGKRRPHVKVKIRWNLP